MVIKRTQTATHKAVELMMAEQHIEVLNDKIRLESEKQSLLRELTLTKLMQGPCENLSNTRCKLLEMKHDLGYDYDASDF